MVRVTPSIEVPESEIRLAFRRAPGPGGQHVNRTETAVELRFNVPRSEALPAPVRQRLLALAGSRVDRNGDLLITAASHRSRKRNIEDAVGRLCEWIRRAAVPPRPRRPTQPTRASRERRLDAKRLRGETKRGRRDTRLE